MGKLILKVIPAIIFWGIFGYVVLRVPYPESLTQGTALQILPFFISLFLAISFTLNIFLKHFSSSFSISLGFIFLLTLQALDTLNIVTGALTIIAIYLLLSYFRKMKKRKLTKLPKIHKLTKSL